MRVHVRKKKYLIHVRQMVLDGKVNNANTGTWHEPGTGTSAAAVKNSLEGCRGGDRIRRPKAPAKLKS